jgi:hypothetical protein
MWKQVTGTVDGAGVIGSLFGPFLSMVLGLGLILGGPVLYLVLQVRALWRWRGAWRLAALPPVVFIGAVVLYTARLLSEGSNLAPILVVFAIPVALLWLVLVGAIRGRAVR